MSASPIAPEILTPYEIAHLYDNQGRMILIINGVMISAATITVALRFYARLLRKLPLQADDWLMLPSLVLLIGLCSCSIIAVHFGLGRHVPTVPLNDVVNLLKITYAFGIIYTAVHWTIKTSILLLYRRIFTTHDKPFETALYLVMGYVTVFAIAETFASVFGCIPISYFWNQIKDSTLRAGTCGTNFLIVQKILNGLSLVADFLILILPSIVLWKLRMTLGRKLGLTCIFLVSAFACAASLLRLVAVTREGYDITWADVQLALWTSIEPTIGLMCGCFPVIAPAFSSDFFKSKAGKTSIGRLIQKIFSNFSSKGGSGFSGARNIPRQNLQLNHWPSTSAQSVGTDSTIENENNLNKIPSTDVFVKMDDEKLSLDNPSSVHVFERQFSIPNEPLAQGEHALPSPGPRSNNSARQSDLGWVREDKLWERG
ncbi:MAG: hypothetical protein MMC33_003499 [Icmadophila ericetorum]|nr:hypothetical protein [Icmadophila ericetorum]